MLQGLQILGSSFAMSVYVLLCIASLKARRPLFIVLFLPMAIYSGIIVHINLSILLDAVVIGSPEYLMLIAPARYLSWLANMLPAAAFLLVMIIGEQQLRETNDSLRHLDTQTLEIIKRKKSEEQQ